MGDLPIEVGMFDRDVLIAQDVRFEGVVKGDLIVRPGVLVVFEGTVCGNFVVERGGRARIGGDVWGSVVNCGGDVVVKGWVGRAVLHEAGDTTRIALRSRVRRNATMLPPPPRLPISANEDGGVPEADDRQPL